MYFSTLLTGLVAAASVGQAASVTKRGHQHKHRHAMEPAAVPMAAHRRSRMELFDNGIAKRQSTYLTTDDSSKLSELGVVADGQNSETDNGQIWIGTDGPFTNTFTNAAGESQILIIWSDPWITNTQPLITYSMSPGQNTTISFANGVSGAWSTIMSDTTLDQAAMIYNTWGEFTMDPTYGTIDVSREVNMLGNYMTIETPNCDSTFTETESECVFKCYDGVTDCYTEFQLDNCDPSTQSGASTGTDPNTGAPSGGCTAFGTTAALHTILGGRQSSS
jgi:hypothetical protein